MSYTPPITRLQAKEASPLPDAEPEQRVTSRDQESSDLDFFQEGANTDDRQSAVEKPAAEKQPAARSRAVELERGAIPSGENIGERLKDLIMNHRRGLKNMYGETEDELNKSLEAPIKRGEEMARKLITEMGCSREVAIDLTVLTLYDVAILICMFRCQYSFLRGVFFLLIVGWTADSDSMIHEENGARKNTLIQFVDHITKICSMANESGILAMRFMNSMGGKKNWTGRSQKYLDGHSYGGMARIGTELKKKILDIYAIRNSKQSKPLLVLIVTDGGVWLSPNTSKAM